MSFDEMKPAATSVSTVISEVDSLEFDALQVGETELGKTTLKRHLTALEAQFTRVTRARLRTLVATRGRATVTRTCTATDSLVVVR